MKQPTKLELVVNAWSLTGVNIRRPCFRLSEFRVSADCWYSSALFPAHE